MYEAAKQMMNKPKRNDKYLAVIAIENMAWEMANCAIKDIGCNRPFRFVYPSNGKQDFFKDKMIEEDLDEVINQLNGIWFFEWGNSYECIFKTSIDLSSLKIQNA